MKFHIGTILTIWTGLFLPPDGEEGGNALLSYLYGQPIPKDQILSRLAQAQEHLVKQLPFLSGITKAEVRQHAEKIMGAGDRETFGLLWAYIMDDYVEKYGKMHELPPMVEKEK